MFDVPCPGCGHEAEIAKLTAALQSHTKWGVVPCEGCQAANAEIARLTAERDALASALRMNCTCPDDSGSCEACQAYYALKQEFT